MGKTFGRILAIGAAIAVNFIPGVGQFLSATLGSALAAGVTTAVTAFGLQSASGLLGLGPSAPKPDTTVQAIKTARPPRVSAYGQSRLYFAYSLYETSSNGTAIDVGAVHDGKMNAVVQMYLSDDPVSLTGTTVNPLADERYKDGVINLYWTDGGPTGTAFSAITALMPGVWTSNHRGDGVVMLAQTAKPVKSKSFLKIYPNQVPVPSMVAQWQLCPDPYAADPANEAGWTWTENPIRQLMHYMIVREGVDYATKIAPTLDYWKAATDVCNAARPLKAGGSEARYRSWVAHKHTDSHASVKAAILEACDGWIAPRSDGAFVVYAGEYIEPSVSIGPAHITSFEWSGAGVDDDAAVNEIIPSYISAAHDYNTVEADAWRDESDISARGAILSEGLEAQIPSWGQARALAKRIMARKNAPFRGSCTTNISGRVIRGHRHINLDLTDAGTTFYSGPVEITAVTRNMATGGVTFKWMSANPNIDAWNPATEEGEPAVKGDRIAPEPLDAPTIDTIAIGADGALLDITGPDRSDLTWFVHWRVASASSWGPDQEYPDIDETPAVQLVIGGLPSGGEIEFEAAYQVGDGRVSPWSAAESTTVAFFSFSAGTMPLGTSFARASGATYWNSSTALAAAANDIARFDYGPATATLRGVLVEPSRINLTPRSTEPSDAGWIVSGTSKTTGQADPAGGTTAALYTGDGGVGIHISTSPDTAVVSGTTYTLSVMVKPGTATFLQMQGRANAFDVANYANFSFSGAGSLTASAACAAGIEKLSGGWFRLRMIMNATASVSSARVNMLLCNSGSAAKNPSFASSETFTMWGAQIEAGAFMTSLIATTSGSGTREADSVTLNWGARGVPDGSITVRYQFDDGSTQNVATTIVGGNATIPTNLNLRHIRSVELI